MSKKRGRPRNYDRDAVIDAGLRLFLENGYGNVTIDQLCGACDLSKPSFYAGFNSKSVFFQLAIDRYQTIISNKLKAALVKTTSTVSGLEVVFKTAIEHYHTWHEPALGCLVLSTVPAEAGHDTEARGILSDTITAMDSFFLELLHKDEHFSNKKIPGLPLLAAGVMQSISIRARAGHSKKEAKQMTNAFLKLVNTL